MAQFDVYRNPVAASARDIPYLLDVQAGLLDGLATRVSIPLMRPEAIGGQPAGTAFSIRCWPWKARPSSC